MAPAASPDESTHASRNRLEEWCATETSLAWGANDDVFEEMTVELTQAVVEIATLSPGLAVLDLASGTGKLAFAAADRVRPGGIVCACDLSPGMIEVAKRNSEARCEEIVRFVQADAHSLPFPNESFDRVLCRLGIMFFRAEIDALIEVRRVLKVDGKAVFLVWGRRDSPFFTLTLGVVKAHLGLPSLLADRPVPFRFSDHALLARVFQQAGFSTVTESRRDVLIRWNGTAADFVHWRLKTTSGPFQMLFRELLKSADPSARERIGVEMVERLGEYEHASAVALPVEIIIVAAER
jgi:ubiquinone/menaquinone biosynthesis C-methylase UbiE